MNVFRRFFPADSPEAPAEKKPARRHEAFAALPFTLIELLVVIAIIAILASMLMPALNKARGTARKGACVNQMKQIALAFISYTDDYASYGPISGLTDSHDRPQPYYAGVMHHSGYLNAPRTYICPEATAYRNAGQCLKASRPEVDLYSESGRILYNYIHYAANDYLVALKPLWGGATRKYTQMRTPSQKLLLAESDNATPSIYFSTERQGNGKGIFATSTISGLTPMIDSRHSGGANIAWGDGHVSYELNASARWQQTIKQYHWDPMVANPKK